MRYLNYRIPLLYYGSVFRLVNRRGSSQNADPYVPVTSAALRLLRQLGEPSILPPRTPPRAPVAT
jgi:hypothetical protein